MSGMSGGEREAEMAIDRGVGRQAFVIGAAFMLAFGVVNATSILIAADREGAAVPAAMPFVEELSSVGVFIALFPLVALFVRRLPLLVETWPMRLACHVAASFVFSAAHVTGMVMIRKALFPLLFSKPYIFFENTLREIVYEYRKDALTYAIFVLILHFLGQLAEHRREIAVARADARRSGRITLKSGGRTIWIPAASFDWAEAAGNYVELKAGGRTHLGSRLNWPTK